MLHGLLKPLAKPQLFLGKIAHSEFISIKVVWKTEPLLPFHFNACDLLLCCVVSVVLVSLYVYVRIASCL